MKSGLALRRLADAAILGGLVLPVALGFGHSLLAAFGHFPALGAQGPDFSRGATSQRRPASDARSR